MVAGCTPLPRVESRWPGGPSQALEIVNRRQCAQCHSVETVFGAPEPQDVEADRQPDADLVERKLPTLASMERFRASWLRAFLSAPHVVRPNLEVRMIPYALEPREIDTLVTGWRAAADVAPPLAPAPAQLAKGAAIFEQKHCGLCHPFGARRFDVAEGLTPTTRLRALAPDLQHTRGRLTRATIEAWILDPQAVKPTSQMPRVVVSPDEARALADCIFFGPPASPLPPGGEGQGEGKSAASSPPPPGA